MWVSDGGVSPSAVYRTGIHTFYFQHNFNCKSLFLLQQKEGFVRENISLFSRSVLVSKGGTGNSVVPSRS